MAPVPGTVVDAHFIFTLLNVLSEAFSKKFNSGVQLKDFFICKNCLLHLTLKSVLVFQITFV